MTKPERCPSCGQPPGHPYGANIPCWSWEKLRLDWCRQNNIDPFTGDKKPEEQENDSHNVR